MGLYYAETGQGACIREARTETQARNLILQEVGTFSGIQVLRKASATDVAWVRAMGGRIPERKKR